MRGIPTAFDRLIQRAIAQVLAPIWETHFHPYSYGFRPNHSAYEAVRQAQSEMRAGKKWVVDLDLDALFGRVNHGRLMQTLKSRIQDQDRLRLINSIICGGQRILRPS